MTLILIRIPRPPPYFIWERSNFATTFEGELPSPARKVNGELPCTYMSLTTHTQNTRYSLIQNPVVAKGYQGMAIPDNNVVGKC